MIITFNITFNIIKDQNHSHPHGWSKVIAFDLRSLNPRNAGEIDWQRPDFISGLNIEIFQPSKLFCPYLRVREELKTHFVCCFTNERRNYEASEPSDIVILANQ